MVEVAVFVFSCGVLVVVVVVCWFDDVDGGGNAVVFGGVGLELLLLLPFLDDKVADDGVFF